MPQALKETLKRARRESDEHIRNSTDLNRESAEHIRQSKIAIQRSLRLLRESPVRT